jgi:hypothetical protein
MFLFFFFNVFVIIIVTLFCFIYYLAVVIKKFIYNIFIHEIKTRTTKEKQINKQT